MNEEKVLIEPPVVALAGCLRGIILTFINLAFSTAIVFYIKNSSGSLINGLVYGAVIFIIFLFMTFMLLQIQKLQKAINRQFNSFQGQIHQQYEEIEATNKTFKDIINKENDKVDKNLRILQEQIHQQHEEIETTNKTFKDIINKENNKVDKNLRVLQEQIYQQYKKIDDTDKILKDTINKLKKTDLVTQDIALNEQNLKLKDVKNISFIDKYTSKEIINFEKIDINKIANFKYREVNLNGSLTSSMTAPTVLDSIIKVANPNGFFTASVNPSTLIQYTQGGGFSSMVKGANGIASHSGFLSSTASVFAPMMVFQALSFITGQYYLHGITRQLSDILNKIDGIKSFLENDDIANINMIQNEIKGLFDKNIVNQQDFNMISKFKIDLKHIKEKYKLNISEIKQEIEKIDKNNIKILEEKRNEIEKYLIIFYGSQQLLFFVDQIEFFSYIKNKDFQYINDAYNRITDYTVEKISFDETLKKMNNLKEEIGSPWLSNKDKEINKLKSKFSKLNRIFEEKYSSLKKDINNTKRDLNKKWNESQEVLCYIDENNNQRLFLKDTNDKLSKDNEKTYYVDENNNQRLFIKDINEEDEEVLYEP